MKIREAVITLIDNLNSDDDYRYSWQANIAMAFKDEYRRHTESMHPDDKINGEDIHNIANAAAIHFLENLTRK